MPPEMLALGGDLGGTSTRILVVDVDGQERGRGVTGGGNPTTDPVGASAALAEALRTALADVDPRNVKASVLGVAGGSALRAPGVASDHFARVWAAAGLTCDPGYLPDLEVAFASGTPKTDGSVLVAGTGAAAGSLVGRRLTRTADGHGWLLGDDGSGFWVGREAVRATLAALDAGTPPGPLVDAVLQELGAADGENGDRHDQVIQVVNSRHGVQLSALAPLVTAAHRAGDPQAQDIVGRAAAALVATLALIRDETERTPIVLAGSLAGDQSPVGTALRALLSARFAGDVLPARSGVGGAAWLALAALDPALATPETHARLCA